MEINHFRGQWHNKFFDWIRPISIRAFGDSLLFIVLQFISLQMLKNTSMLQKSVWLVVAQSKWIYKFWCFCCGLFFISCSHNEIAKIFTFCKSGLIGRQKMMTTHTYTHTLNHLFWLGEKKNKSKQHRIMYQ